MSARPGPAGFCISNDSRPAGPVAPASVPVSSSTERRSAPASRKVVPPSGDGAGRVAGSMPANTCSVWIVASASSSFFLAQTA